MEYRNHKFKTLALGLGEQCNQEEKSASMYILPQKKDQYNFNVFRTSKRAVGLLRADGLCNGVQLVEHFGADHRNLINDEH